MKLFIYSIFVLVHREWKRFLRQKSRVISSLITPLMFWALMGMGFGKSFTMPFSSSGYLEYFFPGMLMMTLLFSSIFSMISLIEDRNEGFLQSVMVSPVSHRAIVFGKILGASSLAVAQSLLVLPFARLAGIPVTIEMALELTVIFSVAAIFMCSLSFFCAWMLNTSSGFHAVMNVVLLPMWVLSGALFPFKNSAPWIQWIMRINPLTYAIDAVRNIFYVDFGFTSLFLQSQIRFDFAILGIFAVFFTYLSLQSVEKSYHL